MKQKEGFLTWLWHRKYSWKDFAEPFLALPFAYVILRMLEGQWNTLTLILVFVVVLIYLPAIVVYTESTNK